MTLGLAQVDDFDEVQQLIANVLADNPDKVKEYQSGKKGILGMFMGLVMKKSNKKRNPQKVNKMIKENLEKIQ